MNECTQLTCNRPSDSWGKSKEKLARKNGEGAGLGREGERSSYSLPFTLFHVCFPPFPISRHCPLSTASYASNRLVHSGLESVFQADATNLQMSIQGHLDLKAPTYSRCNYSYVGMPKKPLFFYFPFCCIVKFLAICF